MKLCAHHYEQVRIVGINGDSYVFVRCMHCFTRQPGPTWIPHNGLNLDDIPIIEDRRLEVPPCRRCEDRRLEVPPCRRCGARGAELHHWAPRALFPDADIWPQDWLCRTCHTEWHQTMTSAVGGGTATTS